MYLLWGCLLSWVSVPSLPFLRVPACPHLLCTGALPFYLHLTGKLWTRAFPQSLFSFLLPSGLLFLKKINYYFFCVCVWFVFVVLFEVFLADVVGFLLFGFF